METSSKQLLQSRVKTNISNQILEVPVVGNHPARIKVERSVVIVIIPTFQSNILPMAKNVSNIRRIISQSFVRVQRKSPVVGLAILNAFQGKTSMKWKNQSLNMTLILWSLNESSSQNLCLTLEKILQTLRISCLMKCQSQRNYTKP